MFSNPKKVLISLVALALFSFSPKTYADDEIRINLPAGAQLKVRNDFGNVSAEVWDNNYVAVSAVIGGEGSKGFTRSPVVIDNRGSVLSISVIRRPIDPAVTIDLNLKIPATSKFEAVTVSGEINLVRVPGSANLKSSSGAVNALIGHPGDLEISVIAHNGSIRSSLGPEPVEQRKAYNVRFGNGERKLEIQSESGAIGLNYTIPVPINGDVAASRRPPELIGKDNAKPAAGTDPGPLPGDEISEGDVIRVESQLVMLNISVIDRGTNRGFVGLGQSDFRLYEDGEEQRIVQFESSSAPFDLILLIDLSGSTREVVDLIRAAAVRFVEAARPADRIGVITFAGQPVVVSTLTADRELLRQRIETIDTARGDTKLYDATNFTMAQLLNESKKSRRSAIVLMSDGLDGKIPGISGQVGSTVSYPTTLRNIQEFDGVLYTLWLNTEYEAMSPLDTQPEAFDAGHDRMKEMADAGGGVFYEVEKLADLAGAYEQVVADLGTMYSLAYRPTNKVRDGSWRTIRIGVNRTNAVPRGKRGYYAN
jgi:VWFA-related protein